MNPTIACTSALFLAPSRWFQPVAAWSTAASDLYRSARQLMAGNGRHPCGSERRIQVLVYQGRSFDPFSQHIASELAYQRRREGTK